MIQKDLGKVEFLLNLVFFPSPERSLVAICFFVKTITICVVKRNKINFKQIIVRIVSRRLILKSLFLNE